MKSAEQSTMLRSQINRAFRDATACFARHQWAIPPNPQWDITDWGLGDFDRYGLLLINLASEPEYCEKLLYNRAWQVTPCHRHGSKKEDIICRFGRLALALSETKPSMEPGCDLRTPRPAAPVTVAVNGVKTVVPAGELLVLTPGYRVTLPTGIWHSFWPEGDECLISEVSTANDDVNDNFFLDPAIGRFPVIIEDEPPLVRLVSEK